MFYKLYKSNSKVGRKELTNSLKKKPIWILILIVVIFYLLYTKGLIGPQKATKLYWFIPDGMRAEESLFTVYKWANEGKLPNIKKMMDQGSYGYSIPDFPSHTPVNFASLLTGAHPAVHGISDGPMRIEGKTLEKPSVGGFSSVAKKVSPIWTVLEGAGKKVALLSIPGSTPPELKNGITIRGRWGNWGSDDAALIFEPVERQAVMRNVGAGFRLFYFGDTLTKFVPEKISTSSATIQSFSPMKEAKMTAHGLDIYAFIIDSTDDKNVNYDSVAFALKGDGPAFSTIKQGIWTDWLPVKLIFQNESYDSNIKLKLIKIWPDGQFRIRVLYNNLNRFVTVPENVAAEMTDNLGPMVDFVDNFPPQLIYEPEDRQTFLDEALMSLDYHKKATDFIFNKYQPDVFLQDIYTPNQMLTSRWWMRYIDPKSADYTPEKSDEAMADVLKMYQGLDSIIGEALKHDDGKTLFVLSSDHGMILQSRIMSLNNLFTQRGWLKYNLNPTTGEMIVDWAQTKVIHMQTNNIYINPNGLAGPYKRASGEAYEKLRNEVKTTLEQLLDGDTKAIAQVVTWEDAPKFFEVPSDRVGDLSIEISPGYGFSEAATADGQVFVDSLTSGNKQAYDPKIDGLQTPFVIMGPGVKKGYKISRNISHVDQMPTILNLLKVKIPDYVQGKILYEIMGL
ncbi:MAG: alkaline phosphatase family protein [Candidatus Daviesbacteria bacterium]|nr:alkaline phosphatase family protein [Candidatus Daviesbacteria bacterium]